MINVSSNVKIITSGVAPTVDNLKVGEMAFGKISSDSKYHLFGNAEGEVADIVLNAIGDNIVTTDMANKTNGYAALDANKGITIEKLSFPSTYSPISGLTLNGKTVITKSGIEVQDDEGFSIKGLDGVAHIKVPLQGRAELQDVLFTDGTNKISLGEISQWTSDTNLKNSTIIDAVKNNYYNFKKVFTLDSASGLYAIDNQLAMGGGGEFVVKFQEMGQISIPNGSYYEESTSKSTAVQFQTSNVSSPAWVVGDDKIKLYDANGDKSYSNSEFALLKTALNGKTIFAKFTDLINNSGGSTPDNVVTTDMANKANVYAALDSNKGIEVEKINFPTTKVNEEDAFTTLTKDSLTINGDSFFNIINGVYGQKLIGFCASSGLGTELYLSPDSTRVALECTPENKAISLASYQDNAVQNWSDDTDLKDKSVVSTVYNTYKKTGCLTYDEESSVVTASAKAVYGMDDAKISINFGSMCSTSFPMGYKDNVSIQFEASSTGFPSWVWKDSSAEGGYNRLYLYESSNEFNTLKTSLNNQSIFDFLENLYTLSLDFNTVQSDASDAIKVAEKASRDVSKVADDVLTISASLANIDDHISSNTTDISALEKKVKFDVPTIEQTATANNTYKLYNSDGIKEYHLDSIQTKIIIDLSYAGNTSSNYNYTGYISFLSGATPTEFSTTGFSGDVFFQGDDCNASRQFVPQAGKGYEVAFKQVNKYTIVARVGSFPTE